MNNMAMRTSNIFDRNQSNADVKKNKMIITNNMHRIDALNTLHRIDALNTL